MNLAIWSPPFTNAVIRGFSSCNVIRRAPPKVTAKSLERGCARGSEILISGAGRCV